MATERIAAKYVYTLEDERPMVDAYVEYDTDTSAIVSVGKASEEDDILDGVLHFVYCSGCTLHSDTEHGIGFIEKQ